MLTNCVASLNEINATPGHSKEYSGYVFENNFYNYRQYVQNNKQKFILRYTNVLTRIDKYDQWNVCLVFGQILNGKSDYEQNDPDEKCYKLIDIIESNSKDDIKTWKAHSIKEYNCTCTIAKLIEKLTKTFKTPYKRSKEKMDAEKKRLIKNKIGNLSNDDMIQSFGEKYGFTVEPPNYPRELAFYYLRKNYNNETGYRPNSSTASISQCYIKKYDFYYWHVYADDGIHTYEFNFDNLEKVIEWLENYFILVTQYDLCTLVRSGDAQGCPQNLPSYIQMKKVYDSKS